MVTNFQDKELADLLRAGTVSIRTEDGLRIVEVSFPLEDAEDALGLFDKLADLAEEE